MSVIAVVPDWSGMRPVVGAVLRRARMLGLAAIIQLALCGSTSHRAVACEPGLPPGEVVAQEILRDWKASPHPLIGTVVRTKNPWSHAELERYPCGDRTTLGNLLEDLSNPTVKIVILGEIHDNPDHHIVQSKIIDLMLRRTPDHQIPVVLEQLKSDQQTSIDAALAAGDGTAEFKRRVGWEKSGWPPNAYDPVFDTLLRSRVPIVAGDIVRASIKKVAKEGPTALNDAERAKLGLDVALDAKLEEAARSEIEQSHCGMLPPVAVPSMSFAQRYRDAHLADVTLAAAKSGSAILIAGGGHARTDRGVPWYVKKREPEKAVVSLMMVGVEDGKIDPASYIPLDPDGRPAADYILFTPRASHGDPCEGMRKK